MNNEFKPDAANPEECDNAAGGGDTPRCNGNNRGTNSAGSCLQPSCGDGYINRQFKPDGVHPEQCEVDVDCTAPATCHACICS